MSAMPGEGAASETSHEDLFCWTAPEAGIQLPALALWKSQVCVCPQIPVGTAGQEMGFTCFSRGWRYSQHGRCSRIPPLTYFQPFSCFKAE